MSERYVVEKDGEYYEVSAEEYNRLAAQNPQAQKYSLEGDAFNEAVQRGDQFAVERNGVLEQVSPEEFKKLAAKNPNAEVYTDEVVDPAARHAREDRLAVRPEAGWGKTLAYGIEAGMGGLTRAGAGVGSLLARGLSLDSVANTLDTYSEDARKYLVKKRGELGGVPEGGFKDTVASLAGFATADAPLLLGSLGAGASLLGAAEIAGARTLGEAYENALASGVEPGPALGSASIRGAGAAVTSPLQLFPATRMYGPLAKRLTMSSVGGAGENLSQLPFDVAGNYIETGQMPTTDDYRYETEQRLRMGALQGLLMGAPKASVEAWANRRLDQMNTVGREDIDAMTAKIDVATEEQTAPAQPEAAKPIEPNRTEVPEGPDPLEGLDRRMFEEDSWNWDDPTEAAAREDVMRRLREGDLSRLGLTEEDLQAYRGYHRALDVKPPDATYIPAPEPAQQRLPGIEQKGKIPKSEVKPAAKTQFPKPELIKENETKPIAPPKPSKVKPRTIDDITFTRKEQAGAPVWDYGDGGQIVKGTDGWDIVKGGKVVGTHKKIGDAFSAAAKLEKDPKSADAPTVSHAAPPEQQPAVAKQALASRKSTVKGEAGAITIPQDILKATHQYLLDHWPDHPGPNSTVGQVAKHDSLPDEADNRMLGRFWGRTIQPLSWAREGWNKAMFYPSTIARKYAHLYNNASGRIYEAGKRIEDRLFSITYRFAKTLEPYTKVRDKRAMNSVLAALREQSASNKRTIDAIAEQARQAGATEAQVTALVGQLRQQYRNFVVTPQSLARLGLSREDIDGIMAYRATMDQAFDALEEHELTMINHEADEMRSRGVDPAAIAAHIQKRQDQLNLALQSWRVENYSPASRYGNFRVAAMRPGGERQEVYFFEKAGDYKKFLLKIKKNGWQINDYGEVNRPQKEAYAYMPLDLFRSSGLSNPDSPSEQAAAGLPPPNWRHHLIDSDLIPGYSTNFERGAADYLIGLASYISTKQGGAEMDAAIKDIPKKRELYSYWSKYRNYMINPSWEGKTLRKAMAVAFLGLNAKPAIINLSQVLTTTWALLSKYVKNSPKVMEQGHKLTNQFLKNPLSLMGNAQWTDLATGLQLELAQGHLEAKQFREMSGRAQGKTMKPGEQTSTDFMMSWFDAGEKWLRTNAFTNGYLAAAERGLPPGDARWKFARDFMEQTQFNYGQSDRPWIQRGWRAPAFIFRNFGGHYYRFLKDNMNKEGFGVVVRSIGASTVLGGMVAAPLIKEILRLAENEGYDPKRWIRREMGDDELTQSLMMGVLSVPKYGIAAGAAMAPTDLVPEVDTAWGPARFLLGVPAEIGSRVHKAVKSITEYRKPELAIENLSPEFLRNPQVALRAMREKAYTKPGGQPYLPIAPDAGELEARDIIPKMFGFTPSRLARAYEAAHTWQLIKERQQDHLDINSLIARRITEDIKRGTNRGIDDLMQEYLADIEGRELEEMYQPNERQIMEEVLANLAGLEAEIANAPEVTRPAGIELLEREKTWMRNN